ncbi:MAG TPA: DUF4235 domain-containing protein [Tetrasphaera sp.]|uniref:DUF4235 domain-containing protein n=1 Tax=Nostocoides sp. TaxID=1917966 RepID=UPI002BA0F84F|nr:DUF4235 domain-containing protein [Tetrasphaera sp.]HNQ06403.1 DUF4235 domain-containing protein [Tetrasphaera sp.]
MGGLVWRVLGTGAAAAAAVVANKSVTAIWKKAGKDDTVDPQNPHTPLGEALALAAVSALAAAVARTMFTRKAAQYYENSSGQLPAPMRKEETA